MDGTNFFNSTAGRIACITGVVAAAGPGFMALSGPGTDDVSHAAIIVIACIVGCAGTSILSVYRFTLVTLALTCIGPLVAGFYIAGLSFVSRAGTALGWALIALALLPLATMLAAPVRIRLNGRPARALRVTRA
jgi:hypothetical protein